MEDRYEEEKKEKEVEKGLTIWDKYKNALLLLVFLAFIAYELNIIQNFNFVIFSLILVVTAYLYSQGQKRGLFGKEVVPYKFPDVCEEAEKIRNHLLERKGWRLEFEGVVGENKHGEKAHQPFVLYYFFRKYNEEKGIYCDWVQVKQSVFEREKKGLGIIDIEVLPHKPVETSRRSRSGAMLFSERYLPSQVVYKPVEKYVVRAPSEEEEEQEEWR